MQIAGFAQKTQGDSLLDLRFFEIMSFLPDTS